MWSGSSPRWPDSCDDFKYNMKFSHIQFYIEVMWLLNLMPRLFTMALHVDL